MQSPLKYTIQARQKFFFKLWAWILLFVAFLFLIQNSSQQFKWDLFSSSTVKNDNFYLPDYNAKAGDHGDIQIITKNTLNNVAGLSFNLVYNPNKITLANNTATNAKFDFVNSQINSPGRLKVIAASGNVNGLSIWSGSSLVQLNNLILSQTLAEGEKLDLTIESFEMVFSVGGILNSQTYPVANGKINISSGGSLQLLSAESVDSQTIKLIFSDYITSVGSFLFNNSLTSSTASVDSTNGKAILVTTSTQTKGLLYQVTVSGISSNQAGGMDMRYTQAYFTGKGTLNLASDFNLISGTAVSWTGISLTFSHDLLSSSVYPISFTLTETETNTPLNIASVVKSSSNNKNISITLGGASLLEGNKNYQIVINKSGIPTDLRRQSDNALLAQNRITFGGYNSIPPTNQFHLRSALAISTNQIVADFSDNLAANTLDIADFALNWYVITNVEIPYNGSYSKVLITLNTNLIPGNYYTLISNSLNGLSSYSGKTLSNQNSAIFVGYGTFSDTSTLALNSLNVDSETQLTLTFNAPLLTTTVIPVNFEILPALTITNATYGNNKVVLTTAKQTASVLYTVVAKSDKIKDQNNLWISNQNTKTFFGYTSKNPKINSVYPNQIINNQVQTILLTGENFETGTKVILGSREMTATINSAQINVTVPVDFPAGAYDLILVRPNGEQIKQINALLVELAQKNILVLSNESYASPKRIPNDGTTPTTLWVRVEDPKGVSDIERVTVDLRPINGSPAQNMVAQNIVDNKRWYNLQITVPNTVVTSETPLALEVLAENKAGEKNYGKVEVIISRNITSSIAPVIEQAYSTPAVLRPGGEEDIFFYTYVKDIDGANTIKSVIINLGPIGGAPLVMSPVGSVTTTQKMFQFIPQAFAEFSAPQSDGQWFKTTEAFRLPSNMRGSKYRLQIIATDETGETGTLGFDVTTSISSNQPSIDRSRVYVTPRESLPNDGKTSFVIHAYVSDPDGIKDITSVMVDLNEINQAPVVMTTETVMGLGGWYKTPALTIPPEVILGIKRLKIYAQDSAGTETDGGLEIKVTNFDEVGDPPKVEEGRAYITPSVAYNDEKTKITLYAFISDKDEDIDYVTINLSNVAKYIWAWSGNLAMAQNTSNNVCQNVSGNVLCMQPSIKEGNGGQWFILPDVVVLKQTIPSLEPYRVWVTAIDKTGKTSQGIININVGDGILPNKKTGFPTLQIAVATSPTTVELVFSNPISKTLLKSTGSDFKISEKNNTSALIGIGKAVINAAGTIVTLTTDEQEASKKYTVIADAKKLGLKDSQNSDTLADFTGFKSNKLPPQIDTVTALNSNALEISFNAPIKPTSFALDGTDFEIFTAEGTADKLKVYKTEIVDSNTVLVTTEMQASNQKYRLKVNKIESSTGNVVKSSGLTGYFKGFQTVLHNASELRLRADFNGDGKVDFTDFTMFSVVYGSAWDAVQKGETPPALDISNYSNINTNTNTPFNPLDTTTAVPYY